MKLQIWIGQQVLNRILEMHEANYWAKRIAELGAENVSVTTITGELIFTQTRTGRYMPLETTKKGP